MSTQPIAAYSFLPWARQGLGIYIREEDLDTTVKVRGSIDVSLLITGEQIAGGTKTETIPNTVQLYGPGDIVGIDSRIIVRTEPRHWITNFETNYLPHIEFYEEDFPWRYTPAKPTPNGQRLRPWLTLVVLEEDIEFREGGSAISRPLPFIDVFDTAKTFPDFDQLWAWAHVHINGGLGVSPNDTNALAGKLDEIVRDNRDQAYSRLLCPRILRPNAGYHAFLIPSFEVGRLAGLGLDPEKASFATQGAWVQYTGREDETLYPYYYRWYFRTSSVGDFEYLVRLLQPRTVDPRVGRRDMDVQKPGANLPGITNLGGILRLGGALRAPLSTLSDNDLEEYNNFEQWGKPYPHPFQTALAAFVNLASAYSDQSAADANANSQLPEIEDDEDPWIVPPLYGRWHSETSTLVPVEGDPERKKWVQELNLDPRHRVAAGFGTQVVQKNQEEYMEAAWQQVGKVLEGNQKIRFGQMARLVSQIWQTRELKPLQGASTEQYLTLVAPLQKRVLANGFTIHHQVQESTVSPALLSKVMRQSLRPGARVSQLTGFNAEHTRTNLLARVNMEEVSAAPPKKVPPELPTEEKLADTLQPRILPPAWLDALKRYPWLRFLPLVAAIFLALIFFLLFPLLGIIVGVVLISGAVWLMRQLDRLLRQLRATDVLRPENQTPSSVDVLPTSPDFRIGTPGSDPAPTTGTTDSAQAARFKESLRNMYRVDVVERAIVIPKRQPLELQPLSTVMLDKLSPQLTIPARVLGSISIPARIRLQLLDSFGEVMVYPVIDVAMYEPLKDISAELFLPNIQLITNNSITLLETNQKFIESYMVGLNHEFARELLWREYPTDQRGSYFRQFWDVRGFLPEKATNLEALRERLYDIPKLHQWGVDSALGAHDNRELQGDAEDELVLVIRGELLKKYPTAVIYAHRADWERTSDNKIDKSRPRKLAELSPAQEAHPPRDIVKTPLYEAKVDPDIYFFGFDLTEEIAKGGQIVNGEEDPGWFFVIKERPGEPRFGLDLPKDAPQTTINTWNDLAWTDVLNTYTEGSFLRIGERAVTLTDPGGTGDLKDQYNEDSQFRWRADTHAAELAYILYQVPVLMAVHAAEMLKKAG
jgi:hypothetical protein